MKKAYLNWSSGKDACLALYKLQRENTYAVEKLVSTTNSATDRVSMHGLRNELLLQQAKEIGLPLQLITLNGNLGMQEYNAVMENAVEKLKNEGFAYSVFGDIFLEDLKAYREEQLAKAGLTAVFPLWKKDTRQLLLEFISAGFKAVVVCVNASKLDKSFCGRLLDENFLNDLPENVDPCGENGEFHTFVFDGPIFKNPVSFKKGEIVEKDYQPAKDDDNCFSEDKSWDTRFYYCDLIPG